MKLFLFKSESKPHDDSPDYRVEQRQRLKEQTDGKGYQQVIVGAGWKCEMPNGEPYIMIKIDGISDQAEGKSSLKEMLK